MSEGWKKDCKRSEHGTIPLYGDIARIGLYLAARPDLERIRKRATTVEAALGRVLTYDAASQFMAQGFAEVLKLQLEPGELTAEEQAWTAELRREKYAADDWTYRL